MRKMSKKFGVMFLTLCLCLCVALAVGCGGVKVTLNISTLKMSPQMQYTLVATVAGSEDTVEWSSSNTAVATVKEGVVTAMQVGEAKITAKVGNASAVCNVKVESGEYDTFFPILSLSQYDATVRVGSPLTITPSISYMGQNVVAEQLTCQSSNTEKVSVTKNINELIVITGLGYTGNDSVIVTITAKYNGYTLERVIMVNVVEEMTMVLKEEIEIYTYANESLNEKGIFDSKDVFTSFTLNGQEGDASVLTWESENEEIATVENGIVKGQSQGVTTVKATYVLNGQPYTEECRVIVDLTTITIDKTPQELYMSSVDGNAIIDTSYYGFKDNNLDFAFVDITDMENSKVLEVKSVSDGKYYMDNQKLIDGLRKIKASTSKVEYVFETLVVTKVIKTADELISMRTCGGVDSTATNFSYGGYFILGNNINLTGKEVGVPFVQSADKAKHAVEGFTGIFDGRGFTVYGGTYYASLFGTLGKDAVVKNVAIINATAKVDHEKASGSVRIIADNTYGTVQDVLVDYTAVGNSGTNGVYWVSVFGMAYNPKFENIVVYGNTTESTTGGGYALTFAEYIFGSVVTFGTYEYTAGTVRDEIELGNIWSFGGWGNGLTGNFSSGTNSFANGYLLSSIFVNHIDGHVFGANVSASEVMTGVNFSDIWDLSGNKPLFVSSAEFLD